MQTWKRNELSFYEIGADKVTYTLDKFDMLGDYVNQGNYRISEKGGTLVVKLFYKGLDGKLRFLERARDLKKITFVTDTLEYDCDWRSCVFEQDSPEQLIVTIKYTCLLWGRWQQIDVNDELIAIHIDSPLQTPIIITAELQDKRQSQFKINGTLFSALERTEPILIDSLNIKLGNTRLEDSCNMFYWRGKQSLRTYNLKNLKVYWRKAYVALD